jgi:C4-dicarboxylate-specific signal transduction histidine kinase
LFAHFATPEDREEVARYNARRLVETVIERMRPLLRGIEVETGAINASVRLPPGTFAEWTAVFQNVFINASNAMMDTAERRIAIFSVMRDRSPAIRVQDTGIGVELRTAEKLFTPFERRMTISAERRALGLGGLGLGLPIVRMIASNRQAVVRFVRPAHEYKTAFELSWTEDQ